MYEIRLIDRNGVLVETLEDRVLPKVPYDIPPRSIVLADYCHDTAGNVWIKPEEYLQEEDVACVAYSRRGEIISMVVGGRRIDENEAQGRFLKAMRYCVTTLYPGRDGGELVFYHLNDRMKERFAQWQKR